VIKKSTSGTTGQPVVVKYNAESRHRIDLRTQCRAGGQRHFQVVDGHEGRQPSGEIARAQQLLERIGSEHDPLRHAEAAGLQTVQSARLTARRHRDGRRIGPRPKYLQGVSPIGPSSPGAEHGAPAQGTASRLRRLSGYIREFTSTLARNPAGTLIEQLAETLDPPLSFRLIRWVR
jgi:hypothetical protein